MQNHILSIILFTPLIGAFFLLFVPKEKKDAIRWIANIFALGGFLISLLLVPMFWAQRFAPGFKFLEGTANNWIPSIGAGYNLGIDGISFLLIMLTTLLGWISILSSWTAIETRVKEYYVWFLVLQTGMLGVFMALDFFLFFVFWEAMLVPMYLLIGIWGGPRKLYAAIKFFLYTLLGSVLMLLGILFLYFHHHTLTGVFTFSIPELYQTAYKIPFQSAIWLFVAFFIGFAIKVPMFPFHTWLPDAHVEAPTAGSVILAGVLLKMGTYGFVRFSLPFFPSVVSHPKVQSWVIGLSLVGIIYGALVSLMQKDMKKLVAYSSVSHLGFCTLGIFALNSAGLTGSVLQQINHGISTGALFLIVGILYERRHTREIAEYGGISTVMPVYATIAMIMFLSSMGLPLLNGFVGEFTILQGAFTANWRWAAWAVPGVVLAAAYLLWLYQRVFFGAVTNPKNEKLHDLTPREILTFAPLIIIALWIGLYPKPFFQILEQPVNQIVQTIHDNSNGNSNSPVNAQIRPTSLALSPSAAPRAPARRKRVIKVRGLSPTDYLLMLPMVELAIFALGILLIDLMVPRSWKWINAAGAFVGVLFAALCVWRIQLMLSPRGLVGFYNSLLVDRFAIYFWYLFLAGAAISILMSVHYLDIEDEHHGEYYALLLLSLVGMMCMAAGIDVVLIYIGLELMAISTYVLVGFLRRDRRSNEAALKYMLLGAFSSGIFAYGLSLFYGIAGSTNLRIIGRAVSAQSTHNPVVLIALLTTMVGLLFKIAAIPFHQWAPDAYEGAPTSITGFMSVAVKAAAWAMLLRILLVGLFPLRSVYTPVIVFVSIATMTGANFAALTQSNTKRLLAYSSIAHVGYMLLAFVAMGTSQPGTPGFLDGFKGILIYLMVYTFMNLGAFAVVTSLRQRNVIGDELDDMAGLYQRAPVEAVLMLLFLLSLAGIPPAAGFLGKYYIFLSLIESQHYVLASLGVVYSLFGLYYYLKIANAMLMRAPMERERLPVSLGMRCAVGVAALATLFIGIYPEPAIRSVNWSLGIRQPPPVAAMKK